MCGHVAMKIVLHIGANKAGSTAIQRYMTQNRGLLRKHGILWPQTGLQGQAHYGLSTWLGFSHGGKALDQEALEAKRRSLIDEFEVSKARIAVLSSEYFVLKRPLDRLTRFFAGMDLKVVAVLRRHDTWWPSLWAQAIKTVHNPPWNRSIEGYLEFQTRRQGQFTDYRALIETWAEVCNDDLAAVAYEASQMSGGVVPAFLGALGVGYLTRTVPPDHRKDNVSQRVDVLSLIDFLQRTRRLAPDKRQALISRSLDLEGVGPTLTEFLSGRLKRRLVRDHETEYAFLDRRFAVPGRAAFFTEPLPEDEGSEGNHVLPAVPAIDFLLNDVMSGHGR